MGPERKDRIIAESNVYTAYLALSLLLTLVTIGLVIYKNYIQYGTIFQIP